MSRKRRNTRGFTFHNQVEMLRGGAAYFRRLEQIADGAKTSLHLQTYIFDEDETGSQVAAALMRAAGRGVAVFVLLDGYASRNLSEKFRTDLKEAGVHFGFFMPVFRSKSFYLGRRLHHKVLVADQQVCMVAGINVSNRYNDIGDQQGWLDWAVCAEGEVARQLERVCADIWNRSIFRERCSLHPPVNAALPIEECAIRIRRNDWVYRKTDITATYRQLFKQSTNYVTLMTGYFWPPQKLLKQMARASARGVQIRLILTARADVPLSKYTERYLYNWLLKNNIAVYEYEKNILHGKIAVRDDLWVTTGSYNMNNISAYASVELNLEIKNAEVAQLVKSQLEDIIINDCKRIDRNDFDAATGWVRKFLYFSAYKITHFIFFVFTFYFRQRKWGKIAPFD